MARNFIYKNGKILVLSDYYVSFEGGGMKKEKIVDKQFPFSKWALKMKDNDTIQKTIDFKF